MTPVRRPSSQSSEDYNVGVPAFTDSSDGRDPTARRVAFMVASKPAK